MRRGTIAPLKDEKPEICNKRRKLAKPTNRYEPGMQAASRAGANGQPDSLRNDSLDDGSGGHRAASKFS